jgi:hypothetical protein
MTQATADFSGCIRLFHLCSLHRYCSHTPLTDNTGGDRIYYNFTFITPGL